MQHTIQSRGPRVRCCGSASCRRHSRARGEVRVKLRTSGVNPSDWKARRGDFGRGLIAPLIIPHSDGAGDIVAVGSGVSDRIGERAWVWNGQWERPHGTAAEYIVLPTAQVATCRLDRFLLERSNRTPRLSSLAAETASDRGFRRALVV